MKIIFALLSLLAPSSNALQHRKLRLKQGDEGIEGSYIVVYHSHVDDVHHRARRFLSHDEGSDVRYVYNSALKGMAIKDVTEDGLYHFLDDEDVAYVEQDQVLTHFEEENMTTETSFTSATTNTGEHDNERALFLRGDRKSYWNLDRIDQRDLPLDGEAYHTPVYNGEGVNIYVLGEYFYTTRETRGRSECAVSVVDGEPCAGLFSRFKNSVSVGVGSIAAGDIRGVAYGANLIGVRHAKDRSFADASDIAAAYDWVTEQKMLDPDQPMVCVTYSTSARAIDSLDEAVNNTAAAGVVTVVPATNRDEDICGFWPGSSEGAIVVTASNINDERAPKGGYGPCVDMFAPGQGVSAIARFGLTAVGDGNGLAAAHVAGAAARYLEKDPSMSPEDVKAALIADASLDKISNPGNNTENRLLYIADLDEMN